MVGSLLASSSLGCCLGVLACSGRRCWSRKWGRRRNKAPLGRASREGGAGAGAGGATFCGSTGSAGAPCKTAPPLTVRHREALRPFVRLARLLVELLAEPREEPCQTGSYRAVANSASRCIFPLVRVVYGTADIHT